MAELTPSALASAVIDAAPDGILLVDHDGVIVVANRHSAELFGYPLEELVGRRVEDLLPAALREGHRAHRERFTAAPAVRPMGVGLELHAERRDGSDLPVEISLSPLHVDGTPLVIAVVRDISARVEADEQLRQAQRALAVADDRERIARDLHDTVIQRLFASGLQLQAVSSQVEPHVRTRLEGIVDGLDETIRELRTAIFALHRTDEAARTLRQELLDVVVESSRVLGFEPRLELAGPVDQVDGRVREQLVPVLREALANVARHAGARSVRVTVEVGDEVMVTVADDGCGIPEDALLGHGLRNLADRAEGLGGAMDVRPRRTAGSMLCWRVPAAPTSA